MEKENSVNSNSDSEGNSEIEVPVKQVTKRKKKIKSVNQEEVEEEENVENQEIGENQDNLENEDDIDGEGEGDNNSGKKKRRKRRTKGETDGRVFVCDLCEKAYLSYPALTNHKKTKHNPNSNLEKNENERKSRGRPKKAFTSASFLLEMDNRIKNFFNKENRKLTEDKQALLSKSDSITILNNIKSKVYEEVYINNKSICVSSDKLSLESHPFLKMLTFNEEETETDNDASPKSKTIDEALVSFLKNSINKTNSDYLTKLIKISCLLRESINKLNNNEIFTRIESAEIIPEYSNQFFILLTESNYLGMTDEDKLDMVEYIPYFCNWLYINGLTTIKLNLMIK